MALRAAVLCAAVAGAAALEVAWKGMEYTVTHNGATLFTGGDIATFCDGQWWSAGAGTLKSTNSRTFKDTDPVLGKNTAFEVTWAAGNDGKTAFVTTSRSFDDGITVTFSTAWPAGAEDTSLVKHNASGAKSNQEVIANFPALTAPSLPNTLSWAGSFVGAQHNRGFDVTGPTGGPTVLFDGSDPSLETVVVLSPLDHFKATSAGPGTTWDGKTPAFAPGTAGTITSIPSGFTQTFVIRAGSTGGITATIGEWGGMLQAVHNTTRVPDVTLEKIGYQTDNGAAYVFCRSTAPYKDCSQLLIAELAQLKADGVPMGYLSFQGAGSSTLGEESKGPSAPWCVNEWGPDLNETQRQHSPYPMPLAQFQKALNVPLQLYAPYFCPESRYFNRIDPTSNWTSVVSDTNLSGCSYYGFQDVTPSESRDFYDWFFKKGIAVGMASFEPDFMNQNYNCVPDFIESVDNSDIWQHGMTDAALAAGLTVQWCYAAPTDILNSLTMPALTNFRVSNDFCYGSSWNVGSSSLIVWAVNAAPSKDTLWTTNNGKFEVPGCPWTPDHESPAAELHVVISLMTTGPVGISDKIGMTNVSLIKRTITNDGTLLKPSKPLTSVDSALAAGDGESLSGSPGGNGPPGHVMSTYTGTLTAPTAWHFVGFKMTQRWSLPASDFYPSIGKSTQLLAREFHDGASCDKGAKPLSSGCVSLVSYPSKTVTIPGSSTVNVTGGTDYAPSVTTVWPVCQSGWALLGVLDTYVPVSALRFPTVTCTSTGVQATMLGTAGERVSVTAVSGSLGGSTWAEGTIAVTEVVIGSDGTATVSF